MLATKSWHRFKLYSTKQNLKKKVLRHMQTLTAPVLKVWAKNLAFMPYSDLASAPEGLFVFLRPLATNVGQDDGFQPAHFHGIQRVSCLLGHGLLSEKKLSCQLNSHSPSSFVTMKARGGGLN